VAISLQCLLQMFIIFGFVLHAAPIKLYSAINISQRVYILNKHYVYVLWFHCPFQLEVSSLLARTCVLSCSLLSSFLIVLLSFLAPSFLHLLYDSALYASAQQNKGQ
jgi:hypothetical protein